MALSINAAVVASNCDENESPQVSKRKSESKSLWCSHRVATTSSIAAPAAAVHRGPLYDLKSIPKVEAAMTITVAAPTACAGPSTRPSIPANHSGVKKYNRFKSLQLSKDEIEATDEKQATVNQLSEWLANEAAKKNKKPPIHTSNHPVRIQTKPRIKKSDVEATDSKRVSVKTLSSWMSDDPFEQKKLRTVRTGHNVIAKSRVFEKEKETRAERECDIRAGSVEERTAWLSGAFKHEMDENNAEAPTQEKNVVRPYQSKPKRDEMQIEENELKSVRDKKEWLSKAFKKQSEGAAIHQTKSFEEQHHSCGGGTPAVHQTKSFGTKHDDTAHSIAKSVTEDVLSLPTINQSMSFDGIGRPSTLNSFERPNVVRLYQRDDDEEEVRPEEEFKSVHDKQTWLSSAFKKPIGGVGGSHHGSLAGAKEIFPKQPNGRGQMIHSVDSDKDSIVDGAADPLSAKLMTDTDNKLHALGIDDMEKMSVADRAKWLKGAFKK